MTGISGGQPHGFKQRHRVTIMLLEELERLADLFRIHLHPATVDGDDLRFLLGQGLQLLNGQWRAAD